MHDLQTRGRGMFLSLVCLVILVLGVFPAAAQQAPTPIGVGEELVGEVSQANIAPAFVFTADNAVAVGVQVRATSAGFAPSLRVLNSAGALVENVANETGAAEIDTVVQLPQAGQYIFQVTTANGFGGQFTINLGDALPAPQPLPVGSSVEGVVDAQTPLVRYSFDAAADQTLILTIGTDAPNDANVTLTDEGGDELARLLLRFPSTRFTIAQGTGRYVIAVLHSGGELPESFSIALQAREGQQEEEQPQAQPTAVPATRIPIQPLPSSGPCVVASIDGGRVNLRSGPSTNDSVAAQLSGNLTAQVTGRLADNSWYQLNFNGQTVWVAAFVVRTGGNCTDVPVVNAPGQPAPTATPIQGGQPGVIDLYIAGVTVTPGTPTEDNDFSVNVTVGNQGASAANNVLVRINLDGDGFNVNTPTTEATIPSIPGSSAVTVNFIGARADDDGDVDLTVTVDPNNSIGESNDGNNSSATEFQVFPNRADLVVSNLDVDTDDDSTQVEVRVVVTNQGSQESEDFQVTLDFDPANAVQQVLFFDDLNPGESEEQFVDVDLGTPGDYDVVARADSTNTTEEAREDNNERSTDFDIED